MTHLLPRAYAGWPLTAATSGRTMLQLPQSRLLRQEPLLQRRSFGCSRLPSPLLLNHELRPQKKTFNATVREGEFAVLPAQEVPGTIRRPAYAIAADGRPLPPGSARHSCANSHVDSDPEGWSIDPAGEVQSHDALERMRKVCKLAATALRIAMNASKPGSAARG